MASRALQQAKEKLMHRSVGMRDFVGEKVFMRTKRGVRRDWESEIIRFVTDIGRALKKRRR